MTAAQAYLQRKKTLSYLQHVSRNEASFKPEEREKRVSAARKAYQTADATFRKLAAKNKG